MRFSFLQEPSELPVIESYPFHGDISSEDSTLLVQLVKRSLQ